MAVHIRMVLGVAVELRWTGWEEAASWEQERGARPLAGQRGSQESRARVSCWNQRKERAGGGTTGDRAGQGPRKEPGFGSDVLTLEVRKPTPSLRAEAEAYFSFKTTALAAFRELQGAGEWATGFRSEPVL